MVDGRPGPNPKAEKWTMRVLGLRGFGVGLRPTVVSSFVGSAATISKFLPSLRRNLGRKRLSRRSAVKLTLSSLSPLATVEVALHLMGVNGGGGVG